MRIGTHLRKLRDKLRLSAREVAEKTGVSLSTYLDWEHDKTTPSLKSFAKLSLAFQLCPVEMMSYITNKSHDKTVTEETKIVSDLKEIVVHFRRYVEDLRMEKRAIELELDLLKNRENMEV